MIEDREQLRNRNGRHWIVTDSGLGGLSICARIERNLRLGGPGRDVRITYFNAWPDPRSGYNSLPDMQSRADAFNKALVRMGQFEPDQIVLACNTLSILYGLTTFSRATRVPVMGIVDAGLDLFLEAMRSHRDAPIVLMGTRTTIESNTHRGGLVRNGIPAERIFVQACHGLAAAIERDPDASTVAELTEHCLSEACGRLPRGGTLFVGLCCTHYNYIGDAIRLAAERLSGRQVLILDPNLRLADRATGGETRGSLEPAGRVVEVEVISKVELDDNQRRLIARRVEPVSAVTALALLSYSRDPDLF